MELLREVRNLLSAKFSKYIEQGIYELRVDTGRNAARIFYFFQVGNKILLTNGFIKKDQKMPRRELDKAIKYKKEYEGRNK